MASPDGKWALFVYDSGMGCWHREDDQQVIGFGWNDGLYMLCADGKMWLNPGARSVPEGAIPEEKVSSMVEFSDFVEGDPNKKGTSKLQIRAELEENAWIKIEMQFDSDGIWREIQRISATTKRSFYIPLVPRRSDHFRIRITGEGMWRVYSIVRENYSGSEL